MWNLFSSQGETEIKKNAYDVVIYIYICKRDGCYMYIYVCVCMCYMTDARYMVFFRLRLLNVIHVMHSI